MPEDPNQPFWTGYMTGTVAKLDEDISQLKNYLADVGQAVGLLIEQSQRMTQILEHLYQQECSRAQQEDFSQDTP